MDYLQRLIIKWAAHSYQQFWSPQDSALIKELGENNLECPIQID